MAEHALGRRGKQFLAGAVDKAERLVAVEGKDGDIDLLHNRAQKRGGLEGAEALGL